MPTTITVDPICGMDLEPNATTLTFEYAGMAYVFCCQECLDIFRGAPDACVGYLTYSHSAHVGYCCRFQRTAARRSSTGGSI